MMNIRSLMGIGPHLQDEQIALYVDALKLKRTNQLPANLRAHVAQCQLCRKNITELFSLLIDEDYSNAGPHPFFDEVELKRSWLPREFVRLAAAIVALVGIAVVVYYVGVVRKSGEAPPSIAGGTQTSADTLVAAEGHSPQVSQPSGQPLASRFEPWPPLEDIVNTEFRSGNLVAVVPKNDETFSAEGQKIEFDWKGYSATDVTLTILDNRAASVYTAQVTALPFVAGTTLPAGLYYWKIQNSAELMHVGKFRVK
jgi:hypothetical protein